MSDETEDARNAVRYRKMAENLNWLMVENYADTREAAESGDRKTVHAFMEIVHERLTAELQEWISFEDILTKDDDLLATGATPALARLLVHRRAVMERRRG
jgi:hypothetical protein